MTAALEVLSPGMMTTLQDRGRRGYQALGIPVSGALDPQNLALANALVGNDVDAGALEIRVGGPTLKVAADSVSVALSGTAAVIEVLEPERKTISAHRSVTLSRGQVFRVGAVKDSACCYLAFSGGFIAPLFYGSCSTYAPGKLGGFAGRGLAAGDCPPLAQERVESAAVRVLSKPLLPPQDAPVRVVLGPQDDYFSEASIETFLSAPYTVSLESNRMGTRLEGPSLEHTKGYNIASDGIVKGAIQVPGNGQPIVLLAVCQTTGGYPKVATVISADLPVLGRAMPGSRVSFKAVDVIDAEAAARKSHQTLEAAIESIELFASGDQEIEQLLLTRNLSSGVVYEEG